MGNNGYPRNAEARSVPWRVGVREDGAGMAGRWQIQGGRAGEGVAPRCGPAAADHLGQSLEAGAGSAGGDTQDVSGPARRRYDGGASRGWTAGQSIPTRRLPSVRRVRREPHRHRALGSWGGAEVLHLHHRPPSPWNLRQREGHPIRGLDGCRDGRVQGQLPEPSHAGTAPDDGAGRAGGGAPSRQGRSRGVAEGHCEARPRAWARPRDRAGRGGRGEDGRRRASGQGAGEVGAAGATRTPRRPPARGGGI